MAYIAHPDGTREEIPPRTKVTVKYLRKVIPCETVEIVYPKHTPSKVFFCDEDGLAKCLHRNPHAEDLYGYSPVVGTIVVLTRDELKRHGWY